MERGHMQVAVETICLFDANVIVVAPVLALFRIFGAKTCRPVDTC